MDTKLPDAVIAEIEADAVRMAGISSAALGYWIESYDIHPDYDTPALRDVARLYAKYERLHKAIRAAMHEIGIPQPGYPANIVNAFDHLHRAFYADIECILGPDDYRPTPHCDNSVKGK